MTLILIQDLHHIMKIKRTRTINPFISNFLLTISFLHFTFTQSTNFTVLDSDGNELQTNTKYNIFPLRRGGGGGLSLSQRDSHYPCPSNVVQENNEKSIGLSLKLFPIDTKQRSISLSADLNIAFTAATVCVQPTVWRLGSVDPFTGRTYVRSGGTVGKPGAETVRNWFKIEKYGEGYKIVYCPSVCSACRVECGDLGLFVESGGRWLGLNGEPFLILFKKVV